MPVHSKHPACSLEIPPGLIVIEDNRTLCEALGKAFSRLDGLRLEDTFLTAEEAITSADWPRVNIALLDLELPAMSGVQLIRWIREHQPHVTCAIHTIHDHRDLVFSAIKEGAAGYVLKGTDIGDLCQMLLGLIKGLAPLSPPIATMLLDTFQQSVTSPGINPLSEREIELLELFADGHSYKDAAVRLGISFHTVQSHVGRIYRKLQTSNRRDAISRARSLGLM